MTNKKTLARILAVPIAAWCLMAGSVGLYRVVNDGWPQALIPGIAFLAIGAALISFTIRGKAPLA